jgi:hypothetical protein
VDFIQATKLTGWNGMTASGSIVFSCNSATYPSTVSVLGGTMYRLDVVRTSGTESTIFVGANGLFLSVDGKRSFLSSDLGTAGLVAFPRVLAAGYPAASPVVTDRGSAVINGTTLRHITLDDRSLDGTGSPWKTTDLYLDSSTGYLMQSVSPVHLSTADRTVYMLETTYANYQPAGGTKAMLPFTISQSLNGQLQWTLSLSQANIATPPSPTTFHY